MHLGKDNLFACLCARFALPLLRCEPWSSRSQTAVQAESRGKARFDYAEAQPALAAEQQPVQAESRGKARFDYAEAQPALAAEQQPVQADIFYSTAKTKPLRYSPSGW